MKLNSYRLIYNKLEKKYYIEKLRFFGWVVEKAYTDGEIAKEEFSKIGENHIVIIQIKNK